MNYQKLKEMFSQESQLLYSINHAAHALDSSRASIYEMMKYGLIKYVQFGRERRIPREEIERITREGMPVLPKKVKKEAV